MSCDPKPTPLPLKQFVIILIVRFSEPVSFTLLFPFVYFMVKDFNITQDPKEIGYYVGYIASSFALSQLCTSIFWGIISDKIGRRPVIILGLLGSSLSLFLFGLSKSLTWAIVSRSMCGLLNGNLGVIKSMVSEITDSTNRAKGFSYLPLVFCMGSIFGPLLGGYLSNPVEKYPILFENSWLFKEYPYLLPCLASSFLCLFGALFAYFNLEETLPKLSISTMNNWETDPLLDLDNKNLNLERQETSIVKLPSTSISFDLSKSSKSMLKQIKKETWVILIGSLNLSFITTFSDELIPIWAATPKRLGGLSFDTNLIGDLMSLSGILGMSAQFLLYPKLDKKLGTKTIYKISACIFFPLFCLYPIGSDFFKHSPVFLWCFLTLLSLFRIAALIFSFTGVNIMVSDTSDRQNLGTINGLDIFMRSLSRAIAPIICGTLWSWSLSNNLKFPFDYHFSWYFLGLISLINFLLAQLFI